MSFLGTNPLQRGVPSDTSPQHPGFGDATGQAGTQMPAANQGYANPGGGEPQHGGLFGHEPLPPLLQHQQPMQSGQPGVGSQPGVGNTWGMSFLGTNPLQRGVPSDTSPQHPGFGDATGQAGTQMPAANQGYANPGGGGTRAPGGNPNFGPAAVQPGQLGPGGGAPGSSVAMQPGQMAPGTQMQNGLPPVPGYTPPQQTPVNSTPNQVAPISGGAQSANPLQPNPGEIASTAPANIQQFGATPVVNPTYAAPAQQQAMFGNATMVDPNSAQSYLNQYGQMLNMGLQPGFQQQDQALAQSLAARGITNSGSAAQLEGNLQGQQAAAFANAYSPMIGQAFGYQQQDLTGNQAYANQFGLANLGYGNAALGANAGYTQQANLTNAGASNQANELNAAAYNQDRYTNAGAYNQYQNELFGQGASTYASDLAAYLNSFGPQSGVTNAMSQSLAGQQNAYNSVYGSALGQQTAAEQNIGLVAGLG